MPDNTRLRSIIENAADTISPLWPLKSFVAANPLAGFEHHPFDQAIQSGQELFGGNGYPTRQMGQMAIKNAWIDLPVLKSVLEKAGQANRFDEMVNTPPKQQKPPKNFDDQGPLNQQMIKYLSAFMDEGISAWSMPGRQHGFYRAWRELAGYDDQLGDLSLLSDLPDDAIAAIDHLMADKTDDNIEDLFKRSFAALPGWVGAIRWRMDQDHHTWQQTYPITTVDYLAVRLAMVRMMNLSPTISLHETSDNQEGKLWLTAWEESYRQELFSDLMLAKDRANNHDNKRGHRPSAQMVFCIDVRSEVIRRHIEDQGNYETLGFAGFFGVPIRYQAYGSDHGVDSCPVLLKPKFDIHESCEDDGGQSYLHRKTLLDGVVNAFASLKKNIASSFGFVEGAGALFSLPLAGKSLMAAGVGTLLSAIKRHIIPRPTANLITDKTEKDQTHGMTHSEQVFYAQAGLSIMGLTDNFAPIVMFCGHGSQTVNNPYASGLDCGACGGNHGGPNARLLARICNKDAVRDELAQLGIAIPTDTCFIAGQHNTTTDEIDILTPELLNDDQRRTLMNDLDQARQSAITERQRQLTTDRHPTTRANDWAEVRPEWGLAGNAGFIAGPRQWTKVLNLKARAFLHSYDWQGDQDGKILETIMTAPLVVAQWINTQYYFSTVDNTIYGSGSKTTQNVTGTFGVMQGNGSDLMTGLAMQSVMTGHDQLYHQPVRLMAAIYAPRGRVQRIIDQHDILQHLFNHEWVGLSVMDPQTDTMSRYLPGGDWQIISSTDKSTGETAPSNTKTLQPAE